MKPTLRKVTPNPGFSFTVRKDCASAMFNNWHYHPEFEILYIKKSEGKWFIGDYVGNFQTGDIVIVGPNLPHCYRHEASYLDTTGTGGETICLLFGQHIFGSGFFNIPETAAIKTILEQSGKGLQIYRKTGASCAKLIEKMLQMSPSQRFVGLLSLLNMMAEKKDYATLSSGAFTRLEDSDSHKIKVIFDYTLQHFDQRIKIEDIASSIHMTSSSFCRFFKKKTRKTFVQFLMEVRIGKAGRLLVEEEKNVAEICYACGYNNLSHFHIHFKKVTGMKPLEYKRSYLAQAS